MCQGLCAVLRTVWRIRPQSPCPHGAFTLGGHTSSEQVDEHVTRRQVCRHSRVRARVGWGQTVASVRSVAILGTWQLLTRFLLSTSTCVRHFVLCRMVI